MFGEVYKKKTKTKELSVYIYLVALPDSESECEVWLFTSVNEWMQVMRSKGKQDEAEGSEEKWRGVKVKVEWTYG